MKKKLLNSFFIIPAALILLLIMYACDGTTEPQPQLTTISGNIVDQKEAPVEGAAVHAYTSENDLIDVDTSDAGGVFTLENIPNDYESIIIKVMHPGYEQFEKVLTDIGMNSEKDGYLITLNSDDNCCGLINVTVKDGESGEMIGGAEVRLNREDKVIRKSSTNDDGNISFENICAGNYWLRIAKDGYRVIEKEFEISECDTLNFTFEMNVSGNDDDCCGSIIVRVIDDETEKHMGNVEVRLNHGDDVIEKGYTNDDGRIIFKNLCPGEYWLRLAIDRYKVIEEEFVIEECDTLDPIFRMQALSGKDSCCEGKVYVAVKDEHSGERIPNATVRLWKGNDKIAEVKTNSDGIAVFEGLCEGKYQISILREHYKGMEFDFELGCNKTLEFHKSIVPLDKDTCCNGKIYIAVEDKNSGERIKNAKVRLWLNGNKVAEKLTNADGIAVFEELCEGKYGVDILNEHYKAIEFHVELGCNKVVELHKALEPLDKDTCCNGKVYVAVKDKNSGERIPYATVRLWKGNDKIAEVRANGDGIAVFEELCEGKYQISILSEHYKAIEFNFELGCNKTLEFHKELEPLDKDTCCNGKIYIAVEDKNSGDRIAHAKVRLWLNGNKIAEKLTNADGIAVFEELCEGKYGLDIISEHYKTIEFQIELGCNKVVEIHKALEPLDKDTCCNGVLYIFPKDKESGDVINGAKVKLWKNGQLLETAEVNNGHAVFDGLCEGEYGVDIIHPDYKDIEFAVSLDCNERKEIVKHLEKETKPCETAVMKLIIKDKESGDVIEGAFVAVKLNGKVIRNGRSNGDGIYITDGLTAPAAYVVVIEKDGYNRMEFEFPFKECKLYQETVKLQK